MIIPRKNTLILMVLLLIPMPSLHQKIIVEVLYNVVSNMEHTSYNTARLIV